MKRWILPLVCLLALCSCSGKKWGPLEFHSPENNRHVTVSGEQVVVMDPIKVSVTVKVPKGEKPFSLELAASTLDMSNVAMTWENNNIGTLTFTQSDGTTKVMHMELGDELIHVIQDIPGEKPYIPLIKP